MSDRNGFCRHNKNLRKKMREGVGCGLRKVREDHRNDRWTAISKVLPPGMENALHADRGLFSKIATTQRLRAPTGGAAQ